MMNPEGPQPSKKRPGRGWLEHRPFANRMEIDQSGRCKNSRNRSASQSSRQCRVKGLSLVRDCSCKCQCEQWSGDLLKSTPSVSSTRQGTYQLGSIALLVGSLTGDVTEATPPPHCQGPLPVEHAAGYEVGAFVEHAKLEAGLAQWDEPQSAPDVRASQPHPAARDLWSS